MRDRNGTLKLDNIGNPKLKDTRSDFAHAIRSLRRMADFVEGSSLENVDANFIVMKNEKIELQNGGQNKQSLWIRQDAFEKWTHFYQISGNLTRLTQNGLVYFIHMKGNLEMFKIGYSTNLNKRLESLQIGNPHVLCVYKIIDNVSRKIETRLHHLFRKNHIRGEWFAITPEMIDFVWKNNMP